MKFDIARRSLFVLALSLVVAAGAPGDQKPKVLRFTGIPNDNTTELKEINLQTTDYDECLACQ